MLKICRMGTVMALFGLNGYFVHQLLKILLGRFSIYIRKPIVVNIHSSKNLCECKGTVFFLNYARKKCTFAKNKCIF